MLFRSDPEKVNLLGDRASLIFSSLDPKHISAIFEMQRGLVFDLEAILGANALSPVVSKRTKDLLRHTGISVKDPLEIKSVSAAASAVDEFSGVEVPIQRSEATPPIPSFALSLV